MATACTVDVPRARRAGRPLRGGSNHQPDRHRIVAWARASLPVLAQAARLRVYAHLMAARVGHEPRRRRSAAGASWPSPRATPPATACPCSAARRTRLTAIARACGSSCAFDRLSTLPSRTVGRCCTTRRTRCCACPRTAAAPAPARGRARARRAPPTATWGAAAARSRDASRRMLCAAPSRPRSRCTRTRSRR